MAELVGADDGVAGGAEVALAEGAGARGAGAESAGARGAGAKGAGGVEQELKVQEGWSRS